MEPAKDLQLKPGVKLATNDFSELFLKEFSYATRWRVEFYNRAYTVIGLFVFSLLIGFFYKPLFWFGVSGVFLLTLQYLRLRRLGMSLQAKRVLLSEQVGKGESVSFQYEIWNPTQMHVPPLILRDLSMYLRPVKSDLQVIARLGKNRKKKIQVVEVCEAPAGELPLGPFQVELQDELGVFKCKRRFHPSQKLVIHHGRSIQKSESIRNAKDSPLVGDLAVPKAGHGLTLFGVREYRDGDPLNLISWKQSTLDDRFMVKELESDVCRRVAFIIGTLNQSHIGYGASSTWEVTKVIALRLIREYLARQSSVSLITPEVQLKDQSGGQIYEVFEKTVNQLQMTVKKNNYAQNTCFFEVKERVANDLELAIFHLSPPSLLYWVTAYSENFEKQVSQLQKLKLEGYEPMLVYINALGATRLVHQRFGSFAELAKAPAPPAKEVQQYLTQKGVPFLWVESASLQGEIEAKRYE